MCRLPSLYLAGGGGDPTVLSIYSVLALIRDCRRPPPPESNRLFLGGVVSYKHGKGIEPLKRYPSPVDPSSSDGFSLPELRVILVNSKVERNTSRMVQTVKERLRKVVSLLRSQWRRPPFQFPAVIEAIFTSIDEISQEASKILYKPAEENGETDRPNGPNGPQLVNGGTSSTMGDHDHHTLQVGIFPLYSVKQSDTFSFLDRSLFFIVSALLGGLLRLL